MKLARSELSRIIKEELDIVLKQRLHEDLSSLFSALGPGGTAGILAMGVGTIWELVKLLKSGELNKESFTDFLGRLEDMSPEEVASELEDIQTIDVEAEEAELKRKYRERTKNLPGHKAARGLRDFVDADKTQAIKRHMKKIEGEE
jgi:hypothetical protein